MKPACLTNASTTDGDTALAGLLLNSLPLNRLVYAACLATVGPAGTRIATIGIDLQKTFHIGSLSKALNGLIYTDMVQAGLISPQDRLEDYLPLARTAAGGATLESCLTQTSGLPATGGGIRSAARAIVAVLTGGDPQPENLNDLMNQLRRSRVRHAGRFSYSNLAADRVSFAQANFWATASEVDEFTDTVMDGLRTLLDNKEGQGRRRRALTTMLILRTVGGEI